MEIQVLLGEDHPVVCEGLKHYFNGRSIAFAPVVVTIDELKEWASSPKIRVIVTEVRLGGEDTIRALGELQEKGNLPPLVFFSHSTEPVPMARALSVSAYDYVLKTESLEVLEKAIRAAVADEPADKQRPLYQRQVRLRATRDGVAKSSPLTLRELQVLRHIAMGMSNREIGASLGISVETTKEHVQNILGKLDVNDRTQAAIWALRRDLL